MTSVKETPSSREAAVIHDDEAASRSNGVRGADLKPMRGWIVRRRYRP